MGNRTSQQSTRREHRRCTILEFYDCLSLGAIYYITNNIIAERIDGVKLVAANETSFTIEVRVLAPGSSGDVHVLVLTNEELDVADDLQFSLFCDDGCYARVKYQLRKKNHILTYSWKSGDNSGYRLEIFQRCKQRSNNFKLMHSFVSEARMKNAEVQHTVNYFLPLSED